MSFIYWVNVSLHVLAAIFWLGGMFFLALVGAPVLRRLEGHTLRASLFSDLGIRFRRASWVAIGVLVLTGILNLRFRGLLTPGALGSAGLWSSSYGHALAWKGATVTAMIVISALHDFVLGPAASRAGPSRPRLRRRAAWLARANAILGVVAVLAAVRLARGG